MSKSVNPVPEGYHTITPYLYAEGATDLINFLERAFAAQETERMVRPDGSILHAEVRIGDSVLMLAEATGEVQPMPSALYLYVGDTDAAYHRAIEAGASSLMEPTDMFYGDRNAGVKDPFGNHWWIATRFEDVPVGELQTRADAARRS